VLALPPDRAEHCNRWQHAARLLLDQADVADVSRQVHLALFYDAQLDIRAMDAMTNGAPRNHRLRIDVESGMPEDPDEKGLRLSKAR
jgi:hypothetical protein